MGATLTSIGAVVAVMLLFIGGPTADGARMARQGARSTVPVDGSAQASRSARGLGAATETVAAVQGPQGGHLSAQLRAGQQPATAIDIALKD